MGMQSKRISMDATSSEFEKANKQIQTLMPRKEFQEMPKGHLRDAGEWVECELPIEQRLFGLALSA